MPIPIEMPKLSDTMTEGTLVKWKKKEGDKVEVGDILAEVETDKATMEMEAFDEGTLAKIFVQEGQKVIIGKTLGLLLEEGEDASALEAFQPTEGSATPTKAAPNQTAAMPADAMASETTSSAQGTQGRLRVSPLARKVAKQHGVILANLIGTGPGGRIVAKDVLIAATKGPQNTATPSSATPLVPTPSITATLATTNGRALELSGMRRTIASRLQESKQQIPHFYLTVHINAEPLMKLRKQVNEAAEAAGDPKVTVNDFVLLAASKAAAEHPSVNASWIQDTIVEYPEVHMAVAVAVEDGLITPVIRNADKLSLKEISTSVRDLAGRARNKKLKPEEYQGGTLTVSNLGAYGIEQFNAIINPPQSLILAVGAIVKKPVVNERDEIVVGQQMTITLSADHRVIDGAVGATYLKTFRNFMENPALMLF